MKDQLLALQDKLDSISGIMGCLKDFTGLIFDETGITYKTEQYYSGCGTEYESFHVTWEELDKPLEYFEEQRQKQIQAEVKTKEQQKRAEEAEKERKERAEFERLSKKFIKP